MTYRAEEMDIIMSEGLTRPFKSADEAARDLVGTMRMHGWEGDAEAAVERLAAGETLEYTRRSYRITEEK